MLSWVFGNCLIYITHWCIVWLQSKKRKEKEIHKALRGRFTGCWETLPILMSGLSIMSMFDVCKRNLTIEVDVVGGTLSQSVRTYIVTPPRRAFIYVSEAFYGKHLNHAVHSSSPALAAWPSFVCFWSTS